jgi:glycosyltransferase involved in cell wall biosynthesis
LECGEHRRFAFGFCFWLSCFWSAASIVALDIFRVGQKQRQKAKAKGKAAMLAALQMCPRRLRPQRMAAKEFETERTGGSRDSKQKGRPAMHVLFVHRALPAQFGRLAFELVRRHGWRCTYAFEHLSHCPSPSQAMLDSLELLPLPRSADPDRQAPWPQAFGQTLERARVLAEVIRGRRGLRPDLVVGHGGLLPTLLLREVLDCPLVDYCEYCFAPAHRDLSYRVDLPAVELAPYYPRCLNAATLLNLAACDKAYAPTRWQRDSFGPRFADRIEVHFDGIDTELYRPGPGDPALPAEGRVVTFVARGLESLRGFDLFVRLARRIARARSDVLFVVAGDEKTYYGWDGLRTGGLPFKEWVLRREECDGSRFRFLGHVEPEALAGVLRRSDLHVYLGAPFVVSWSLCNALACGCVVLAGDVPPVREILEPGVSGLVEPLFDEEGLAQTALRVLADPAEYRPLGAAGRRRMEEEFSLEAALPGLMDFFERAAAAG